jgi:purine-binding chemotaxis protein CheW
MSDTMQADVQRGLTRSITPGDETRVLELLAFVCNDEIYAVELGSVHEIVIPPPITMVPRSPPAIVGVCSVRGELATVVDLRTVLSMGPQEDKSKTRVLLARVGASELVGLLVDEVRQVVRLREAQVEYSSQSLGGDVSEGVLGIGRPQEGEVIVILDLAAVLNKGCV